MKSTHQGTEVRAYIAAAIPGFLQSVDFVQSLTGHVPGDDASQARVPLIREHLRRLSSQISAITVVVVVVRAA